MTEQEELQSQIYNLIESATAENLTIAFEISKSLKVPIDFLQYTRTWMWLENLDHKYFMKVRFIPHEVRQELTGIGDIYIWLLMQETDFCRHKSFGIFNEFPIMVTNMVNVEKIVLTYQNIQTLPKELLKMKNLKELNLQGNPLLKADIRWFKKNFPTCNFIYDAHLLNEMSEEESQISQFLDSGILENVELAYAIAESNDIKIDEESYEIMYQFLYDWKQKGFYGKQNGQLYHDIKTKIQMVADLEVLDLTRFKYFNRLPVQINKCAKLRHIDLHGCSVDRLPTTLINLSNLTYLDVSYTNIPKEFVETLKGQMPNCKVIYETYENFDLTTIGKL